MRGPSKKRLTLMPAIAVAGLALAVTLPALSSVQLHAAQPATYTTVTVRSGDSLWRLAEDRTAAAATSRRPSTRSSLQTTSPAQRSAPASASSSRSSAPLSR